MLSLRFFTTFRCHCHTAQIRLPEKTRAARSPTVRADCFASRAPSKRGASKQALCQAVVDVCPWAAPRTQRYVDWGFIIARLNPRNVRDCERTSWTAIRLPPLREDVLQPAAKKTPLVSGRNGSSCRQTCGRFFFRHTVPAQNVQLRMDIVCRCKISNLCSQNAADFVWIAAWFTAPNAALSVRRKQTVLKCEALPVFRLSNWHVSDSVRMFR